eukprot:1159611-Pelagomonas_calceolata.AAC.5
MGVPQSIFQFKGFDRPLAGINFSICIPNSNPCYCCCCCCLEALHLLLLDWRGLEELSSRVELHKRGSHTGRECAPTKQQRKRASSSVPAVPAAAVPAAAAAASPSASKQAQATTKAPKPRQRRPSHDKGAQASDKAPKPQTRRPSLRQGAQASDKSHKPRQGVQASDKSHKPQTSRTGAKHTRAHACNINQAVTWRAPYWVLLLHWLPLPGCLGLGKPGLVC